MRSIKYFKKWQNLEICLFFSDATAIQSRQNSRTFTVNLAVFAPQPRWRSKTVEGSIALEYVYKTWTPGPWTPGPWTTPMDPVHGPLHGPGPWTTPVNHPSFCKITSTKIFRRKREVIFTLTWTIFPIISNYGHLRNSGGFKGIRTHDLCDAGATLYQLSFEATHLGAGQFVGLICSREGFGQCNELIFGKRFLDEALWSHQYVVQVSPTGYCLN